MSKADVFAWLGAVLLLGLGSFHYGRVAARVHEVIGEEEPKKRTRIDANLAEAHMLLAWAAVVLTLAAITVLCVLIYKADPK